jgi:hypothetical protein
MFPHSYFYVLSALPLKKIELSNASTTTQFEFSFALRNQVQNHVQILPIAAKLSNV